MQLVDECTTDLLALIEVDWPGSTVSKSLHDILPRWLTYKARAITQVRRKVVCSNRVIAVRNSYPAIEEISKLLRDGGNLKPYLHKPIYTDMQNEASDLLFLDWGIHHFHLGKSNSSRSVSRTDDLLFAYVESDKAFLLDVRQHGVWTNEDLIRALVEVAPHIANQHQIKGVMALSHETDATQRSILRKNGVNSPVNVDGKYYVTLGGGISAAKTRVGSLRKSDQLFEEIAEVRRKIETGVINVLGTIKPPYIEKVAVLRAGFRAGRIVVYEESSRQVLVKSPVIR